MRSIGSRKPIVLWALLMALTTTSVGCIAQVDSTPRDLEDAETTLADDVTTGDATTNDVPSSDAASGDTALSDTSAGDAPVNDTAIGDTSPEDANEPDLAASQCDNHKVAFAGHADRSEIQDFPTEVNGDIYVLVFPPENVDTVLWHIDDPEGAKTPYRTELDPPFDLQGDSGDTASPFDTRSMDNGEHSITATIFCADGTKVLKTATFEVKNIAEWSKWPTSASEALARSPFWDPDVQVAYNGDLSSQADGDVIENLRIKNGKLQILHNNVQVRNVTILGRTGLHGDNALIDLAQPVTGLNIDGVHLRAETIAWNTDCDKAIFPTAGFRSIRGDDEASWTMRNFAIGNVGDGLKVNTGTGIFEDGFIVVAVGHSPNLPDCENDHTDTVQIEKGGPDLVFRRIWMDALPYELLDKSAPATVQKSAPGGATSLQLSSSANVIGLIYDTVRFHSGNYHLRIYGDVKLTITDSESHAPSVAPVLIGPSATVEILEWSENTDADGNTWERPSN